MKRGSFLLIAAIMCGLFLTACASPIRLTEDKWEDWHDIFRYADVIPDNRLDKGEFDMYHQAMFSLIDINQDGSLSRQECLGNGYTGIRQYKWTKADRERAGLYRLYEFSQTPQRFEEMDADFSGSLSVYEYIFFGRERFSDFDKDGDKVIRPVEFCQAYRPSATCDVYQVPLGILQDEP